TCALPISWLPRAATRPAESGDAAHLGALPRAPGARAPRGGESLLHGVPVHPGAGPRPPVRQARFALAGAAAVEVARRWAIRGRAFLLRIDRKSTRLNSSHVKISYA